MNPSLLLIPDRYKAAKLYSQIPDSGDGDLTFARNSNATRVNSAGLIEKVRTNTFLYSEDFSDATWIKERTSVSSNVTTAPDGTSTADKIVENTDNNSHRARQNANSTQNLEYTLSCYLKAAERTKARLIAGGLNAFADFDLSAGSIIGTPTLCTASIVSAGNGWYRCAITYTQTSVTSAIQLHLIATLNAAGDFVYTGDGTSGIFVWGASLEIGVLTDYIPTTTAAVSVGITANIPRLDYTGGGCPSLLLEPQRTNLALNSEIWNGTGWIAESASVTANSVISPSGYQDADTLTGTGSFSRLRRSGFTLADNTDYSVSSFLKAGTAYIVRLTFIGKDGVDTGYRFNLQDGTAESGAKIENYGNGWYRCSFTANSGTGVTAPSVRFASNDSGTTGGWTTGLTIYAWGAQLEAGSYATSYIPTLGSSVTRLAEVASKTGISSLIGQSEGTMFIDADYIASTGSNFNTLLVLFPSGGVAGGYVVIDRYPNNTVVCEYNQGGSQAFIQSVATYGNERLKIAFAYKVNDFVAYVNGVQIGTDNSGTTGLTLTNLVLPYTPNAPFGGKVNAAALYTTRLSNSQLASLTSL
jgi:hypothetical protein